MKRAFLVAVAAAALFHLVDDRLSAQSTTPSPLNFFKSYFVTGDWVVGGAGLNMDGVGDIAISGVPEARAGVDVVAAFLYWQVVTNERTPDLGGIGVTFKPAGSGAAPAHPLSATQGTTTDVFAKVIGAGTPPCWSSGGSTGGSNGSKRTFTYRMDVLRYFNVDPATGKLLVNTTGTDRHRIQIPVSNQVEPLGASLVIIYREAGAPLRSIVLYDGAYTMGNKSPGMTLPIRGFYDGTPGPARLGFVAGSGQNNFEEFTRFSGYADPLATNAFRSSLGAQWDNPVFSVQTPAPPTGGITNEVTASVSQGSAQGSWDCVTFAAVIYSTAVNDADGDGLLDVWEEATTALTDPNGMPLPNLNAMGARSDRPDLFVEVGYMETGATTYGGVSRAAHSHLPGHEALRLVGDAFVNQGIQVHFDVGPTYPSGDAIHAPDQGLFSAEPYLVPRTLARGGEMVPESVTNACTPGAAPWECQFKDYPGTVGWKTGYRFIRDELFSISPAAPAGTDPEDLCGTLVPNTRTGERYVCERRFDENRRNMFRYSFFAHALGLPKSESPCLDAAGQGTDADANDTCAAPLRPNPEFRTPRTNAGIGDFPGADSLISLGAFLDVDGLPVGTPFMQASTLMHEIGHNLERRHGGEAFEPNCKPTYLSVMNYLYQLRGLLDDNGVPHLDFAGSPVGVTVNEAAPTADAGSSTYRLGWYAPLDSSYLAGQRSPAARRCDGSVIEDGARMVRIDAPRTGRTIDWDADGAVTDDVVADIDLNFSGSATDVLMPTDDWSHLKLNQIGVRRNVGASYIDPATGLNNIGPYSLDTAKGDLAKGDLAKGDLAKGDLAKGDLAKGDLAKGDLAKGDLAKGDLGSGDLGRGDDGGGDLFKGDPRAGEIDAEMAKDLARTPPNRFQACVVGDPGCTADEPAGLHDVKVTWQAPNVIANGVTSYTVYRVQAETLIPGQEWDSVGTLDQVQGQTSYTLVDTEPLVDGAPYIYFAAATYSDGVTSDVSRLAPITGVNDPATAGADSYATDEDTPLLVPAANGVLANDGDPDEDVAFTAHLVSGPAPGTGMLSAFSQDGSFTFVPAANYNGTVTFTYNAVSASPAITLGPVTVTIAVRAVNDAPVADHDSYAAVEDTLLSIPAAGVLGNDSDVETQANLTAVLVQGPLPAAAGVLALAPTGGFTFTPALNFNGPVTFTYQALDEALSSNTATVTITVAAVDDPPAAGDDSYSLAEDGTLNVSAPGVLQNDGDADGTALTAVLATGTSSGVLALSGNGSFTYTPNANFAGTDTFTYRMTSGGVASAPATVTITVTPVNDAPTISAIANQTIFQDTPTGAIAFTVGDLETLPANLSVTGSSSNTTLVPNANIAIVGTGASRTVTITPAAGRTGTATITLTVTDTNAPTPGTAISSFTVTVQQLATFRGIQNTPPNKAQKTGSSIPMVWQYNIGNTAQDSALVAQRITVTGPNGVNASYSCTNQTGSAPCTDSGSSFFRYDPLTRRWSFNLQTKDANGNNYAPGAYTVAIEALTPGFRGSSFTVNLVR